MSSIVVMVPAYNSEKSIALSLESCIAQTVCADVVIVDNCSTDTTRDIVKAFAEKHPNVTLVVNEKNLGRIGNFNQCLDLFKNSKYEYVQFLFTGDVLKPDCIEEVQEVFKQHPDLGAVFWPYEFKEGNSIGISRHYEESRYLPPDEINELNIIDGGRLGAIVCNVYSKRAIVKSGAYFNEVFIGKADFDYCVLQHHGAFHLNKVLSTFNVEHHGTFQYARDNYRVNIEGSFNSACALERSRHDFPIEKYEKYRSNIIMDIFKKNIHFLKAKELIAIQSIVIAEVYRIFKGCLSFELRRLYRHVKQIYRRS